MTHKKDERGNNNPIKLVGIIISYSPSLILKSSRSFLRFKRKAKKAGRIFRKELLKQGFNKKTAGELTNIYLKGSHLIKPMIKKF